MMVSKNVYEHDFVGVGDVVGRIKGESEGKDVKFEQKHFELLVKYSSRQKKGTAPFYTVTYRKNQPGIKFGQYVGVLVVKNICFMVWPKVDENAKEDERWKDRLIYMLEQVKSLKVNTLDAEKLRQNPHVVFNIFIKKYLEEVDALLNKGLIKTYRKTEGNRTALKGKLLFNKQIACNFAHQERFYVKYTTYDYNHILNRILRQALKTVPAIISSSNLKGKAASMLLNFPELLDLNVTPNLFRNLVFDRKSEDYRNAIKLAEMILLNFMPDFEQGGMGVWSMMFDMNKLWEEFIFRTLQRKLPGEYEVLQQRQTDLWKKTDANTKKIVRADIVIHKQEGDSTKTFVLDTKWKMPEGNVPSDGDLHQMYVYLHKYGDNVEKVALLYPGEEADVMGEFNEEGRTYCDSYRCKRLRGRFCRRKFVREEKKHCDMLFLPGKNMDKLDSAKWLEAMLQKVLDWLEKSESLAVTGT